MDTEHQEIVRATMPLTLELYDLSPRAPKGEKHVIGELERRVRDDLWATQRDAATAKNAVLRALLRADENFLDDYRATHNGENPKRGKDWPFPKLNTYRIARDAAPELDSGIASACSQEVQKKWMNVRWDALIWQKCAPPFYKVGTFSLRSQEMNLRSTGKDSYELSTRLRAGKGQTVRLPIRAYDAQQREVLSRISANDWKMGGGKCVEDRFRRGKWYARISYKRIVPKSADVGWVAINRGIRNFLVAITDDGEEWRDEGRDIVAHMRQIQARRKEHQRQVKTSGRIGHGRVRTLRPIERLYEKHERWRRTRSQTTAARFADWCVARKKGMVVIEDFSGIRDGLPEKLEGDAHAQKRVWQMVQEWPYYQLALDIQSALEKRGIRVMTVSAQSISTTCPKCSEPGERDLSRWRFRCGACSFGRDLDVAAAMNVLLRGKTKNDNASGDDVAPGGSKERSKKPGLSKAKKTTKKGRNGSQMNTGLEAARRKGQAALAFWSKWITNEHGFGRTALVIASKWIRNEYGFGNRGLLAISKHEIKERVIGSAAG